jgi:hypothetical protein
MRERIMLMPLSESLELEIKCPHSTRVVTPVVSGAAGVCNSCNDAPMHHNRPGPTVDLLSQSLVMPVTVMTEPV